MKEDKDREWCVKEWCGDWCVIERDVLFSERHIGPIESSGYDKNYQKACRKADELNRKYAGKGQNIHFLGFEFKRFTSHEKWILFMGICILLIAFSWALYFSLVFRDIQ